MIRSIYCLIRSEVAKSSIYGLYWDAMNKIHELAEILSRHSVTSAQLQSTAVPRLQIFRADRPTLRTPGIYNPMICLVAAGKKQVFFGEEMSTYGESDCFLITVDLPVIGTILTADSDKPYLALCLDLHIPTLANFAIRCSQVPGKMQEIEKGLLEGTATDEIIDAAIRLAKLLDAPQHIDVLAQLYEQEFLYRLYSGPWGQSLNALSHANSRLSQVSRAIAWLHKNYAEEFSASGLAKFAGMSVSTLNRYFREVAAMSPLEYQKRIRLQEARRLLASHATDVAGAGYAVGYSSPTQFNREYRRLFGAPPGRDSIQLRNANGSF